MGASTCTPRGRRHERAGDYRCNKATTVVVCGPAVQGRRVCVQRCRGGTCAPRGAGTARVLQAVQGRRCARGWNKCKAIEKGH